MPPPSAYTPFESLLFFQSLASLDSRPASFVSISDTLRNNSFIRQNAAFNPERLSPEALEELYTALMRDSVNPDGTLATSEHNGRAEMPVATNPKKRKISSPRPKGLDGVAHATVVPDLVSRLYARYKELVTREIKNEEERFTDIRDEIERLKEEQEVKATQEPPTRLPTQQESVSEPVQQPTLDAHEPPAVITTAEVDQSRQEQNAPQPKTLPSRAGPGQQPVPPQAVGQSQELAGQHLPSVPAAIPGHVSQPPPANGKASSGLQPSIEPRPTRVSQVPDNVAPLPQALPPALQPEPGATTVPVAPPLHEHGQDVSVPQQSLPVAKSADNQMSPIPSAPQNQPDRQQLPLDHPQTPSSIPAHAPVPQPNLPVSKKQVRATDSQQAAKLEAGKPCQTAYSTAMPTTPGHPSTSVHTPVPVGHDKGFEPTAVAASLPETRSAPPLVDARRSLTPWKKLPRLSIPNCPSSPAQPLHDNLSPISDNAPSPEAPTEAVQPPRRKRRAAEEKEPTIPASDAETRASKRAKTDKSGPATRRKRDGSTPSSKSRRSVVSREEGSPSEAAQERIKHEAASTPAEVSEDVEPSPRAADRKGGAAAAQQGRRGGRGRAKRKRSVTEAEAEPIQPEPNQYVLCARNFPRTGAPIMNDVTTHKHASIFTKPLTEREAPGYRDLIYRPQDLKSIKGCITQGSKAVAAASEAASTPAADGESPAPGAGTPSKNAVLMLQKSEDIVPPKAIVNSAQLEKELIRMFANAVMYNPTPQRGFGPAFPMVSEGESGESPELPESDEGGIVNDAMEMFDDVEKAVTRWRAAERTADELAHKNVLSVRRGSVGDLNTDSADDSKG